MGLLTIGEQAHSHIRGRLRPRSIETIFNALNQGLLVGSIIFSNSRRARTANFILALQNSAALGARIGSADIHHFKTSSYSFVKTLGNYLPENARNFSLHYLIQN